MKDQRKRVAKRLASGLLAGALALGGLALSGGEVSANTPSSPTTNRISGADRYETAAALARAQLNTTATGTTDVAPNITPDSLIIASGESFADALAGAQLATDRRPLLLVKKDSIPAAVSDWIADYKTAFATGSRRVFILGGTNVISAATATAIQTAITTAGSLTPPIITRLSGDDRYATAKAISDFTDITGATDALIIANGENFPDALSAGAVAAQNGWPMILSPSSGLNASVKAKIDSFIALPGGTREFVIVGSEAVVPRAIEEYIINTKGISGSKIRRIQGADRYQTNLLVNSEYLLSSYDGANVALVSGEAPWDALAFAGFGAKTNTHLVLTPTAGGNTNVSVLAATLAYFNDAGFGMNQRLWIIGGTAAVSSAARTGYVAASATDMTATLTCPTTLTNANRRVVLTLSGRAEKTAPAFEDATLTSISALPTKMLKNNVALTGSISAIADANLVGGALAIGTTRKTYNITLVAPPALNDVITFSGFVEGTLIGTTGARPFPRSIGSASCTVGADTTRPTVSITSVAGTGGTNSASGGYFWINASEPITVGSGRAIQTNGDAVTQVNFNGANPTVSATIVPIGSPSTRGSGAYYTNFLMTLADITAGGLSTEAQVPFGTGATTLIVSASAFADANGLTPSSEVRSTVSTDSASPTITPIVLSNTPSSVANYRVAPLSISASSSGDYYGAKGSGWSLTVVNQRGLLKPTVVENATAKTLVVTADIGYHTPADVAQVLENNENSNWDVEEVEATFAGNLLLRATVSPASCLAAVCGTDVVVVALIANEPVHGLANGYTVSVGGYGTPFVTGVDGGGAGTGALGYGQRILTGLDVDTSRTLVVTSQFEGTGTISFQGATAALSGVTDLVGNYLVAPVTFTVT